MDLRSELRVDAVASAVGHDHFGRRSLSLHAECRRVVGKAHVLARARDHVLPLALWRETHFQNWSLVVVVAEVERRSRSLLRHQIQSVSLQLLSEYIALQCHGVGPKLRYRRW